VGPVIIAGDAINSCENIITDTPGGITSDATAAAQSMHRITALADAVDANLIVSHDLDFFHQLPKAPQVLTRLSDEARSLAKRGVASVYPDLSNPSTLI
jgi:predicted Zn-dependent protease